MNPPSSLRDRVYAALATWFGLGLAPIAPGTFGTLGGVALAALYGWTWPGYFLWLCWGTAALLTWVARPVGDWAEGHYGRKDPGAFVLDEVAGYLVAVALPGVAFFGWPQLLAAFLLFRLTDIVKPWPARSMEKVPGGMGIVLDDLVAGVWALAIMGLLHRFLPQVLGL